MSQRAFITGVSGLSLTPEERDFIAKAQPWGLILFARNVQDRAQLSALTAEFRQTVGRSDAPVLIDQEGGRVQRMKLPHWSAYPAASAIGRIYTADPAAARRASYLKARLIGADLQEVGIDVDCAPALDLGLPGAHPVIGERAFASDPCVVVALAAEAAAGFIDAGVLPVIKHMPGHGRGLVDSHHALPIVDCDRIELERTDFAPFRHLSHIPLGMTGHVVFSAIDREKPATHSRTVVEDIIRGSIGFRGALMTDDLGMNALGGGFGDRAARALEAGVDLALHCSGVMGEMVDVAAAAPLLAGEAARRCAAALAARRRPRPFDRAAGENEFHAILAHHGEAAGYAVAQIDRAGAPHA